MKKGQKNPHKGVPRSPETRSKMSASRMGKTPSEQTRKRLSESKTGKNNPNYGKHPSEETRQKMSIAQSKAQKGKQVSEETREKISEALKGMFIGENNPFYGKHHTPETRAKLSEMSSKHRHTLETKQKLRMAGFKRTQTPEARAKVAKAQIGNKHGLGTRRTLETRAKQSAAQRGERGSNWRGGISFEPYCPKFNNDLRRRIRAFFEYQCVLCGKTTEENKRQLSCHHVEYNKAACCDGEPVHFAALCHVHHLKTNSDRERWESMIHRIIDEIYDGRSYFTKDEWAARGIA